MSHAISVRIARSCAGAERAVTSAVRMCIDDVFSLSSAVRWSLFSAASSGFSGPPGSGESF